MFRAFRDLLQDLLPPETGPQQPGVPSLRLAAAVLLMEVMRATGGIADQERDAATLALREQFDLPDGEMDALLAQAERESLTAYDYFRFTNPLDEQLPQARKVALVEAMWRVALADRHLEDAENAVIRQVADLLHVTHGDYIAAKLRARDASAAAPGG